MDGRTEPKILTGTDFGTRYGFLVRIFIGTVHATDFGTDSNLVRYVVRIFVRKNPYRNGFFSVRYGLRRKFRKYIFVPERIFVTNSVTRTVPNIILYQKSVPRTIPYQFVPTVRLSMIKLVLPTKSEFFAPEGSKVQDSPDEP